MTMPGRNYSSNLYRYGFNGKENDKDISEGVQDYGMRIYDTKLGRFLSVDPLMKEYPELTPYQFASNTPIQGIDLDGEEVYHYTLLLLDGKKPVLKYLGVQTKEHAAWEIFDNENDFESFNGDEIESKSVQVHAITREGNGICHAPTVSFNYFKELIDWKAGGFEGSNELKTKADDTKKDLTAVGLVSIAKGAFEAGTSTKMPGSITPRASGALKTKSTPQGQTNSQVTAATGSSKTKEPTQLAFGNKVHYDIKNGGTGEALPTELTKMFPQSEFRFTIRGGSGADVKFVGGQHPSTYPNSIWTSQSNFADFKSIKTTSSKFNLEIKKGKLPAGTQRLNYGANGKLVKE